MGLHVYCIVPAGVAPPAGLIGLADAPVEALDVGGVALWFSRADAPPAPAVEAARVHNAVVAAAMTPQITPVPARFGQWFASEEAAGEKLAADEAKWRAELARFAGRAEYGVRVAAAGAPAAAGGAAQDVHPANGVTGTQYMLTLARKQAEAEQRTQEADRIADALAAAAGSLAVERRAQVTKDGVAVAHLVAWTDASSYHTAVRRVEERRRDLRFLFTGPWPPYSFVHDG